MGIVNKKECPKCKGANVRDTGVRVGTAVTTLPGREIPPQPNQPIYKCEDCGEQIFIE